jgi:halocyanin-like protein
MNRREFLQTAGGAAGGAAAVSAASPAAAAEAEGGGGGGQPDFGGWLDNVGNYDGTVVDARGESEVAVTVGASGNGGNLAFDPPAVHVDTGTTIVWEWTGEGGSHNVVEETGAFESELTAEEGFTYEQTFSESGIVNYYCNPHRGQGMKGSVVVGDDFPTTTAGGGPGPVDPAHMGVPFQAHFVGIATILAIVVSLIFTFFLLKYGESAHTSGGNN